MMSLWSLIVHITTLRGLENLVLVEDFLAVWKLMPIPLYHTTYAQKTYRQSEENIV